MNEQQFRENIAKKMDLLIEVVRLNGDTNTIEYALWLNALHCLFLELFENISGEDVLMVQMGFLDLSTRTVAQYRKRITERTEVADEKV